MPVPDTQPTAIRVDPYLTCGTADCLNRAHAGFARYNISRRTWEVEMTCDTIQIDDKVISAEPTNTFVMDTIEKQQREHESVMVVVEPELQCTVIDCPNKAGVGLAHKKSDVTFWELSMMCRSCTVKTFSVYNDPKDEDAKDH